MGDAGEEAVMCLMQMIVGQEFIHIGYIATITIHKIRFPLQIMTTFEVSCFRTGFGTEIRIFVLPTRTEKILACALYSKGAGEVVRRKTRKQNTN